MRKGGVVTSDRTMWWDELMSLQQIIQEVKSQGHSINMTRTFRLYGLKFYDERRFSSKYRVEFGLGNGKTMWDITLKEMRFYRDGLIGFSVKGY